MDADAVVKFEMLLSEIDDRDVATLHAMQQTLAGHVLMAEAAQRGSLLAQGWTPNPPGLTCQVCGGATWGKQVDGRNGALELVRCADPACRAMRTIVL